MSTKSNSRIGKWSVLGVFTAVAGVSQMLWLNFAPLLSQIQSRYGVTELEASSLILVFPALYVVFSLHAGALIDRRGYPFVVGAGSVLMALCSCVRIYDSSFAALLIGQIGIAVAQPYIVNGISKLVADWFEEDSHGLATGIGTIGMFSGMAIALALTPALSAAYGLRMTMVIFAAISVAASFAFVLIARENTSPSLHSREASFKSGESTLRMLQKLIRNPNLVLLFVLSTLALGFFNGLTTWLEPILAEQQINPEDAGLVGGMLIIGGIFGSAIIPAISDAVGRRRPFLLLSAAASVALVVPLCTSTNFNWLLIYGGLMGFFFLPGYALLFAMTEEHAGARYAGSAAGVLMLAGNAGGVIVVILMESVKGQGASWINAVYLMMALMIATGLLALRLGESLATGKSADGTATAES
ncbi:MAG: MFS transporter [Leptospirales bacterium]|jgi:predicted MFS family arabinose efflux permease